MNLRRPTYIYNKHALEQWFEYLQNSWESFFSKEELFQGRNIYHSGIIRGIDLTSDHATIYFKKDEVEYYAVVEWNDKKLEVRASIPEKAYGRALSVAGMYQVEELVADEIDPIRYEPKVKELDQPEPLEEFIAPKKEANLAHLRDLNLKVSLNYNGLVIEPYWLDSAGNKILALKHKSKIKNTADREKIIQLVRLAKNAHFKHSTSDHIYILEGVDAIRDFLKNTLQNWAKYFKLEKDHSLNIDLSTTKETQLEAQLKEENKDAVSLSWSLSVGDHLLSGQEVKLLLKSENNIAILPSVGVLSINPKQRETLIQWKNLVSQNKNHILPKYMILSIFAQDHVKILAQEDLNTWYQSFKSQAAGHLDTLDILRSYQREGVLWMAKLLDYGCHPLLADEMGLGKTLQVLNLLHFRKIPGKPSLIVCPSTVIPVWEGEIVKFFPDSKVNVLKKGCSFMDSNDQSIWLASYTQLRRHKAILKDVEFGYSVLDEAQYVKNPDTKVTHACLSIIAKHRIALSGTPIENRYLDLWTIFRYLMPGLLGARKWFEKKVLSLDDPSFFQRFKNQVSPFILRRTKKDVLKDLPDKVEVELECDLTALQKREYEKIANDLVAQYGNSFADIDKTKKVSFFSILTRLRQVCCDASLLPWVGDAQEQGSKVSLLLDKLKELTGMNRKIVIFSQFTTFLKKIKKAIKDQLPDVSINELTGTTRDRATPVTSFQDQEGTSIILVSLKAGGVGVTLHAADYVFLMDPWWNPAVENQAIDRVHRFGQDKTVFVYRLFAKGTIEEHVKRIRLSKLKMIQDIGLDQDTHIDFEEYFDSIADFVGYSKKESH